MRPKTIRFCVLAAALLATATGSVVAQEGAIAGRIVDATTLDPIPAARISVVGGSPSEAVTSRSDGSFQLRLPAGVYDLLVEAVDFSPTRFDRVTVSAGQTTTRNLPLESQGFRLAGFIVTASRGSVDTEITAPSSSHSVPAAHITERPATSMVEHLRESPGVDIGTQGLQSSNLVVRGFNNIFSGALHLLTDDRLAGLPSLRVNFMHFLPHIDDDIDRVEVVLGAGSALYGPNTANGVVNVITKSPLEEQGTTVTLGTGERSLFEGSFRTAFLASENFGVKVSGHAMKGEEWSYIDPAEAAARLEARDDPEACTTDRALRGLSNEDAAIACGRVGARDPQLRRYGIDARADWRFSSRGEVVGSFGVSDMSGIELTGLSAVQIKHWLHQYVQGRLSYDRWSVQGYFNSNDSGDAFFLRDGLQLVDRSTVGVFQAQNGFEMVGGRQDVTYGVDYFSTRPESRGTIYGNYENENDIKEWGVYLQSKTVLSPKLDLIAVGRIDNHSILPDNVFSPRVALIVKPNERNAIRFAYNQAFSTPTTLNHFLDIGAGAAPDDLLAELGYTFRAFGTGRDGFAWRNVDGTLRGIRSPLNPGGPGQLLPADVANLWDLALALQGRVGGMPADALTLLRSLSPGQGDVGISFFDPEDPDAGLRPLDALQLRDMPAVRESKTETFEVGWSGVFSNAVRISADVYVLRQNDFVSPLTVETPLLHLNGQDLGSWLGAEYVPLRVSELVAAGGLSLAEATSQATAEAAAVAGAIGPIPLAVAASDAPQMASGSADLIASYRNLGDIGLWGGDVTLQWFMDPEWTLSATYSHVSENWFTVDGEVPLALNAPSNKGTVAIRYRNAGRGLSGSARVRYTGRFPFLSTVFDGTACIPNRPSDAEPCIDAYALLDVTLGYKIPNTAATLQLGVTNVLDEAYRSFVGVPSVGRMAMVRVKYDLF